VVSSSWIGKRGGSEAADRDFPFLQTGKGEEGATSPSFLTAVSAERPEEKRGACVELVSDYVPSQMNGGQGRALFPRHLRSSAPEKKRREK